MDHSKLLDKIQSIVAIYNLAEHPMQQEPPDYRQVARAMRDAAEALLDELIDEELEKREVIPA